MRTLIPPNYDNTAKIIDSLANSFIPVDRRPITREPLPRLNIQRPPIFGTPTKIVATLGAVTAVVAYVANMLFDGQQNETRSQMANASLYVGATLLAGALLNGLCSYFAAPQAPRELTLAEVAQRLQFTTFDANRHTLSEKAGYGEMYTITQEREGERTYLGPLDENNLPHSSESCEYVPTMEFKEGDIKYTFLGSFTHGLPTKGVLTRSRLGRQLDRFELAFHSDGTIASSKAYNPPAQPAWSPSTSSSRRFQRVPVHD